LADQFGGEGDDVVLALVDEIEDTLVEGFLSGRHGPKAPLVE
jgi:hypothetical protein